LKHWTDSKSELRQLKIAITGGLGDCLLATPFIKHFRETDQYENILVAIPANSIEIFDLSPSISTLIPCQGRDLFLWAAPEIDCDVFSPYVRVYSPDYFGAGMDIKASPLFRPNQGDEHVIRQVANFHSIKLMDESLEIFISSQDETWAKNFVYSRGSKPIIFLNAMSQHPEKNMPVDLYEDLVRRLSRAFHIIQFEQDGSPHADVELVMPTPGIRRAAALIKRLHCVVTVDSFPGHLAHAVGTPAIVLFGPSNPSVFGHPSNYNIRSNICPVCADSMRRPQCRRPRCMEALNADEIVDTVESIGKDYA